MNRLLAGTLAGIAATAPMSVVMLACRHFWSEQPPPKEITKNIARKAGVRPTRDVREPVIDAAALSSHFGYGAAMGACYGALNIREPVRGSSAVARGVAYGMGVWAASYAGWLPALGIMPLPHRQSPERNVNLIASHIVWGSSLGLVCHLLRSRSSRTRVTVPGHRDAGPVRDRGEAVPRELPDLPA